MATLKIAIIGAGGMGIFHAREFARLGAEVVALLGTSKETTEKTAEDLFAKYGIRARAYFDIGTLLATEQLDAVSVCTPPQYHYSYTKKCLESGLHVLCEKPFVLESDHDNTRLAIELIELAKKVKRVVTVNTQWPSVLKYVQPFVDISEVNDFYMYTQPGVLGKGMLWDHVPHSNSMLVKLIPGGVAEDIQFTAPSPEEMNVSFKYRAHGSICTVNYKFKFKLSRPRDVEFAINGIEFKRDIQANYIQQLKTGNSTIDIKDPLQSSIGMFIGAIQGQNDPLITSQEIIENMRLQDAIIEAASISPAGPFS